MNKKALSITLAGALAFTGLVSIQPAKTEAAMTKGTICNNRSGGSGFNQDTELCASQNYKDVTVHMYAYWISSYGSRSNWKMSLQRYEGGSWKTIGTRTGYLAVGSPSHRTFTNVAQKNAKMRVKVTFTEDGTNIYTRTFTR